jgi:cell wall-associated NlpC family hydrolase
MILTVCNNADLLSVMILVRKLLDLLQIIVPIGLIIFISIDVLRAIISNKQDEIYKKLHAIPIRIAAAVIIFFIPTIISFVMSMVDNTFEYASCFDNASEEFVEDAYISNAYEAVLLAESSFKMYNYDDALLKTNKIKDAATKTSLQARLMYVLAVIKQNNADEAYKENSAKTGTVNIITGGDTGSTPYHSTGQSTSGSVTFVDSNKITNIALSHLGLVYVWGGESWTTGVDCSGFIYRVYNDAGYNIGRTTASNYRKIGCNVSNMNAALPGDLIIYGTRHIAIYLGKDTTGTRWRVHASGDQDCHGKTATSCQVKKDTNVFAARSGEVITIRRIAGAC